YSNIGACPTWTTGAPTGVSTTAGDGTVSAGSVTAGPGNDRSFILTVSYPTDGTYYIYFTLKLTNDAGDCATGATQHVSIGNTSGDATNNGNKTVPLFVLRSDQFIVHKTFSDSNPANVTISLECTAGDIDPVDIANDDTSASISDPANFTVTGGNGDTTCTATETSGPAGYTTDESDCVDVALIAD